MYATAARKPERELDERPCVLRGDQRTVIDLQFQPAVPAPPADVLQWLPLAAALQASVYLSVSRRRYVGDVRELGRRDAQCGCYEGQRFVNRRLAANFAEALRSSLHRPLEEWSKPIRDADCWHVVNRMSAMRHEGIRRWWGEQAN